MSLEPTPETALGAMENVAPCPPLPSHPLGPPRFNHMTRRNSHTNGRNRQRFSHRNGEGNGNNSFVRHRFPPPQQIPQHQSPSPHHSPSVSNPRHNYQYNQGRPNQRHNNKVYGPFRQVEIRNQLVNERHRGLWLNNGYMHFDPRFDRPAGMLVRMGSSNLQDYPKIEWAPGHPFRQDNVETPRTQAGSSQRQTETSPNSLADPQPSTSQTNTSQPSVSTQPSTCYQPSTSRERAKETNEQSSTLSNSSTLSGSSTTSVTKPTFFKVWDRLSESIWTTFKETEQSELLFKHKITVWNTINVIVKEHLPQYGLYIVGSTISGFGCNSSDLDICLVVRPEPVNQRYEALLHLEKIRTLILDNELIQNPVLIPAKVPLLKFTTAYGFQVDLNCNNFVGIRNTHLLYSYSQLDYRIRPFATVVKLWAQFHHINDAKTMTISSYSLMLMVIHFLQAGVTPPVLPCLHTVYPEKYLPDSNIFELNIQEKLPSTFKSENRQQLGELLIQFLGYYSTFDFQHYAISVRLGLRVPITYCRNAVAPKNDPSQWGYLCIEEPFELTNTARSVYDYSTFAKIKRVFASSYETLKDSQNIDDIFVK